MKGGIKHLLYFMRIRLKLFQKKPSIMLTALYRSYLGLAYFRMN